VTPQNKQQKKNKVYTYLYILDKISITAVSVHSCKLDRKCHKKACQKNSNRDMPTVHRPYC